MNGMTPFESINLNVQHMNEMTPFESINLNVQHMNGMTHFNLALHGTVIIYSRVCRWHY